MVLEVGDTWCPRCESHTVRSTGASAAASSIHRKAVRQCQRCKAMWYTNAPVGAKHYVNENWPPSASLKKSYR